MQKTVYIFLLSFLVISARAQNHGAVRGIVLDSLDKQPVPFATVSVMNLKDSSLMAYTITDKKGEFTLRNLRTDDISLLISHVGYSGLRIALKFKKDELTDLGKLYLSAKLLAEVTVKGERIPVIIKKDTIEFDAAAFKTRPNAVVEDLLKKLPGVQVNFDGQITVNGKDISKIKVNGKDFFINDPKIATKNLDADMISKVQIYDDREDDPDHLVPDYEVKKIINLKFKKNFIKSLLSNVGLGAGTQDRYDAKGFFGKFKDDLQISGNAYSDNLNGTNFSNSSVMMSGLSGFSNSGITKRSAGSFSINKNITKKFKLNLSYQFGDNRTYINKNSRIQQFLSDTTLNTLSTSQGSSHSDDHELAIQTEWKPDSLTIVKYNPNLIYNTSNNANTSYGITSNTFMPLINTTSGNSSGRDNSFRFSHYFNYYHVLNKKGASFNITNNIVINPSDNYNLNSTELRSYVATLQSDTLRRSSQQNNREATISLSAGYHYPISKKLSADFVLSGSHARNGGELLTYDQDFKTGLYTIFLQDQSSDLIRDQWDEYFSPTLTYHFTDKIYFKAGPGVQLNQTDNHFNNYTDDLVQHYFYLLPTFNLFVSKFVLSYRKEINQPSINELQPITIVYSPLYTFIGNPALQPASTHNFGFNFNDYHTENQLYYNFSAHVSIETNTVVNINEVSGAGATISTPVNRNGRFTTYFNGGINKTFKKIDKWQISYSAYLNGSYGHNFFIVNQQSGYQNTASATLLQNLDINRNDVWELNTVYSINPATTSYQNVAYKKSTYTTQKAEAVFSFFLPKKYTWKVNYQYGYNPLVAPGFQRNSNILNFLFSRRIQQKDKGEIAISCYDILNQSISFNHFASGNTINDSQSQLLKRYFLLSYTYHFKAFTN